MGMRACNSLCLERTYDLAQRDRRPTSLITVGDHIRRKRLQLGLLQSQLAESLGVDKTTVYNWERNATEPARRFLCDITSFLGYSPTLGQTQASRAILTSFTTGAAHGDPQAARHSRS